MKLRRTADLPPLQRGETVFRTSTILTLIPAFVATVIFLACVGVYTYVLTEGPLTWYGHLLFLWFIFWVGLFAWILNSTWNASRRPSNWLIRFAPGGGRMFVKFRSYLNDHFPEEDRVVLELSGGEVSWIRKVRERQRVRNLGDNGFANQYFTYLDFNLACREDELDELRSAIETERTRKPPVSDVSQLNHELFEARKAKAPASEIERLKQAIRRAKAQAKPGPRKSGVRFTDYPVRLTGENVLRLSWKGMTPRANAAIEFFRRCFPVEAESKLETDHTTAQPGKDLEDQILDLVEKGNEMEAIALVRGVYGYSLVQAKQFVEELRRP
ncbi:MAG: hypothetical protein COV67_01905 [Nitrospinae bacterium CG11_big_fil_rev_8_21_14_0_20_56_8]|nr:MAG: hypothetical protein COV67_01905 [Nitrospinae bacterium CG11_big_fil_rev_8_21_14_0_20_56_8]